MCAAAGTMNDLLCPMCPYITPVALHYIALPEGRSRHFAISEGEISTFKTVRASVVVVQACLLPCRVLIQDSGLSGEINITPQTTIVFSIIL